MTLFAMRLYEGTLELGILSGYHPEYRTGYKYDDQCSYKRKKVEI